MLSPVVCGRIRTWTDDCTAVWHVDDADRLARLLGQGLVARTEVEPGRFREVGLLEDAGLLLVPARTRRDDTTADAATFSLTPARADGPAPGEWDDFADWLGATAVSAARRGDFLVIESGGWDHQPHPYALFACTRRDGRALSLLEASPAPTGGQPPWPSPPLSPEGATVTAPASEAAIGAAGYALAPAVWQWAPSPLDLALTYGRSLDGSFLIDQADA